MSRIRIDDLPVSDSLAPEQEDLVLGAGLRSFRPSLESLEGRAQPSALALMTQPVQAVQAQISQQVAIAAGTNSMPATTPVGTDLQRQLQAAITGQGGRVDLQQVGKVVLDAANREASALWGAQVAAGNIKLGVGDVTPFNGGVRMMVWLSDRINAKHSLESGFEVNIKYDNNGAVTAESAISRVWGHDKDVPFMENMAKTLGITATPTGGPATLAEGFL